MYRTVVRDVLGVPNPLGTVKLCGTVAQVSLNGFVVVATYTRELCQPIVEASPSVLTQLPELSRQRPKNKRFSLPTPLQGLPHRDNYPCEDIPVRKSLKGYTC